MQENQHFAEAYKMKIAPVQIDDEMTDEQWREWVAWLWSQVLVREYIKLLLRRGEE